jgi:WD40 repeat protein
LFCASDRTIKVWNIEALVETGHTEEVLKLSSQAVVAAHDKDINSLAVAPNDSLLCSGSQVCNQSYFLPSSRILCWSFLLGDFAKNVASP